MSWSPRNTSVSYGTTPYDWNAASIYECTWYAYWRVQEGSGLSQPPCWFSGSGSSGTGAYTNARYWLDNYRDPWEVKGLSYSPVAGDIIVFTGTYGHVVVVEAVNGNGTLQVSDYNLIGGHHSFGFKSDYTYGDTIQGYISTGACIGALHNPNIEPTPPTPPTPTETLEIEITPSSYSVTMSETEDYKDFTFGITITGIPAGQTVSGGNTYPGLSRIYNTGWSYSDYTVNGIGYRSAVKTQTLRYDREHNYAYTITKHMYFSMSFSTGTIASDTPMNINVKAKPGIKLLAALSNRRRQLRRIFNVFRI